MEWLVPSNEFTVRDRHHFEFRPNQRCEIIAISIEWQQNGGVAFQSEALGSAPEYGAWIKRCRPSPLGSHRPALLLAMHKRLKNDSADGEFSKSTTLAYGPNDFRDFSSGLCQHRTLATLIGRLSTAVIAHRPVTWEGPEDFGRSTVYHCKSDTESLNGDDDITLSTTCFHDEPITLAVMYGCTDKIIADTTTWLKRCKWSVFHPLVLPMVFAEHERKRLLNAMDKISTELWERIFELEGRINMNVKEERPHTETGQGRQTMTQRDCEAISLWRSMSSLMNGLESLYAELVSIREHLTIMPDAPPNRNPDIEDRQRLSQMPGVLIQSRLQDMTVELRSKIRSCEGALKSMTLATQLEWNYYTRLDAQINFGIAVATRTDGVQLKRISTLGMIFLPGIFIATFFSMSFFHWEGEGGAPEASPWLFLYCGLSTLVTSGTTLWLHKWSNGDEEATEQFKKDMAKDIELNLFSRLSFRNASLSDGPSDIERGNSQGGVGYTNLSGDMH